MPAWVPAHREVILGSGVAEIVLGAGLLHPATRQLAGWGSVALLLGVFPANLKMAADAHGHRQHRAQGRGAWRGCPVQWPMVKAALTAARGDG